MIASARGVQPKKGGHYLKKNRIFQKMTKFENNDGIHDFPEKVN